MATILIVDDRPTTRQFLLTLLGYGGHHLLEAADGAEALEQVRAARPDLVVTDILMPTMDGYEFVQRLRAEPDLAATPVIFYTATYRTPEARLLARTCGVQEVLAKPSEPQQILEAVKRVLDLAPAPLPPFPAPGPIPQLEYLRRFEGGIDAFAAEVEILGEHLNRPQEHSELRQRLAALSASLSALRTDSLRLKALVELGLELLAERDPAHLGETLCGAARRITGAAGAGLALLKEDECTLDRFFWTGEAGPPRLEQGALGRVLAERRPLCLGAVEPADLGLPPDYPARGFLGLPLATATQLYGLLYLVGEAFAEEEEKVAAVIAAQAALICENLQLYDLAQRHAARLQVELSQRQQAEAILRQREQRFRALIEHSADAICLNSADGTVLYQSPAASRILGYSTEEMVNANPFAFVHPEDLEEARRALAALRESPESTATLQCRLRHKDGSWRWIEAACHNLLDEPGVQAIVANCRDITPRKQREA